jgi:hypothetical protein
MVVGSLRRRQQGQPRWEYRVLSVEGSDDAVNSSFCNDRDELATPKKGPPQFALRTANYFHLELGEYPFLYGNSGKVAAAVRCR